MNSLDRFLMIVVAFIVAGAWYNAREAHRHAHELACHVDHQALCKFYKPE